MLLHHNNYWVLIGEAGTRRALGRFLPTLLCVCRPMAASAYTQGNPWTPYRLLPFLSALHSPFLRGRAGLGPSRCGVKGAWSGPQEQQQQPQQRRQLHQQRRWQVWPRASWPGAPGGRGRRKGRKRGRRRRRGAVSRPEEAGLPGVGVVNSPERERQNRELLSSGETQRCHEGGDLGDPLSPTTEAAPPGGSGG